MHPRAAQPRGVAGYISHRLSVAGGADDRVHFSPNAIDAVFRVSGGVPRVINLICDRALHRGHLAAEERDRSRGGDAGDRRPRRRLAHGGPGVPHGSKNCARRAAEHRAACSEQYDHGAGDVGRHSGDGTRHCGDGNRRSGDGARRSEQRAGRSDAARQVTVSPTISRASRCTASRSRPRRRGCSARRCTTGHSIFGE